MNKKGILKIAEVALLLGITAGSTAGLFGTVGKYTDHSKRYKEMLDSEAVTEYIQDDLDKLNLQYGDIANLELGKFNEYRKEVKKLRVNGAEEIYGEEFKEINKDVNVTSPIVLSVSGVGIVVGLSLLLAEALLKSDTLVDVVEGFRDANFDEKFLSRMDRGLEKVEDVKKNFVLENIYRFQDRICIKVGERYNLNTTCFVYDIDPSKLTLPQNVTFNTCVLNEDMERSEKKYLINLVKSEAPAFVGNEEEAYKFLYDLKSKQEKTEDTEEKE